MNKVDVRKEGDKTYIFHYIQSKTLSIYFSNPKALYLVIQPLSGLCSSSILSFHTFHIWLFIFKSFGFDLLVVQKNYSFTLNMLIQCIKAPFLTKIFNLPTTLCTNPNNRLFLSLFTGTY